VTNYLLDTNILSDLVRHPQGAVYAQIRKAGETAIVTSVIVAAELRFGALKKGSSRLSAQLEAVLDRVTILPFDQPADVEYAKLRVALEAAGTIIGANDMLIAAHALSIGSILVTGNESEFRRVPGLTMENWLRTAG